MYSLSVLENNKSLTKEYQQALDDLNDLRLSNKLDCFDSMGEKQDFVQNLLENETEYLRNIHFPISNINLDAYYGVEVTYKVNELTYSLNFNSIEEEHYLNQIFTEEEKLLLNNLHNNFNIDIGLEVCQGDNYFTISWDNNISCHDILSMIYEYGIQTPVIETVYPFQLEHSLCEDIGDHLTQKEKDIIFATEIEFFNFIFNPIEERGEKYIKNLIDSTKSDYESDIDFFYSSEFLENHISHNSDDYKGFRFDKQGKLIN